LQRLSYKDKESAEKVDGSGCSEYMHERKDSNDRSFDSAIPIVTVLKEGIVNCEMREGK
jgi:hypothetical protein